MLCSLGSAARSCVTREGGGRTPFMQIGLLGRPRPAPLLLCDDAGWGWGERGRLVSPSRLECGGERRPVPGKRPSLGGRGGAA